VYRRLLDTARLWKDGKAGLFRDPDLQIALAWREAESPNAAWAEEYGGNFDAAIGFLDASHAEAQAERQAREAARQRELDQARELAEARKLRLEQQQRAARRLRKLIAGLAVVAVIAAAACAAALLANQRARRNEAKATRSATEARQSQQEADQARTASEGARVAAQAEAYRAMLSEARALRAGREPGWRDSALADLARLAAWSNVPGRDLFELRTEAAAAVATPDVRLVAQIEPSIGPSSFAFDPEGSTLAIVGGQSALDFWKLPELTPVATSEALGGRMAATVWNRNHVVYLPGDEGLAVGTLDQGVVFTDRAGKRTSRAAITHGTNAPQLLSIDAAGTRLAVSWGAGGVTVHDLDSGGLLEQVAASACALSPDGQWLAYGAPQSEVRVRRIGSKVAADDAALGRHQDGIARLAFSADGRTLASASRDRTAMLWDVATAEGKRRQPIVLRGHRETLNDVSFSPDGGWVATASTDYTARIWDASTGQLLVTLPGGWFRVDAGWSPDGGLLAVAGDQGLISLYRVTGRQIFRRLVGHRHGVQSLAAHPRLEQIATGADDHTVINWGLAPTTRSTTTQPATMAVAAAATTQPWPRWIGTDSEFVTAVAYTADGSLLASATGFGAIVVRDAETGEVKARLAGTRTGVESLAFDPSGRRLGSGDRRGQVTVWDLDTEQPVQRMQVGGSWVWSIAFLDEGRKLVSEVSNGSVSLFDVESGKREGQAELGGGVRRFIADPARRRLIVVFGTGDLCSLSVPDLTPGRRLERAQAGGIDSLALSADGRLLATGGADRRVVLRDAMTFEPLLALPQWTALIKGVAFTPSGRWLAYVGADSDVALWDLAALREGLAARGLAWDQRPGVMMAEGGTGSTGGSSGGERAVPILRPVPTTADSAALEQARRLVVSGVAAYREGRSAEAVRDLQQARDGLRPLREAAPANHQVASLLGISLAFLDNALRDQQQMAEAAAARKDARAVLESIRQPTAVDLYNLACTYASLMEVSEPGAPPPTPEQRDALAKQALAALQRSIAAGMNDWPMIEADHSLDPLRDRPEFTALLLEARGRAREAVAEQAKASAAKPSDLLLALRVGALQAWFGEDRELAATCARVLKEMKDTEDLASAERTAKLCSLHAVDAATHEAALVLARRAVQRGASHPYLPYFQLALGMAEYRCGHFAEAEAALQTAARLGPRQKGLPGTSGFYRAMCLYREGKAEEARKVALAAAAKMSPLPANEENPLAGNVSHDDLIQWLAYKEAKALIHFETRAAATTNSVR
jgi:WD40 repeat protein